MAIRLPEGVTPDDITMRPSRVAPEAPPEEVVPDIPRRTEFMSMENELAFAASEAAQESETPLGPAIDTYETAQLRAAIEKMPSITKISEEDQPPLTERQQELADAEGRASIYGGEALGVPGVEPYQGRMIGQPFPETGTPFDQTPDVPFIAGRETGGVQVPGTAERPTPYRVANYATMMKGWQKERDILLKEKESLKARQVDMREPERVQNQKKLDGLLQKILKSSHSFASDYNKFELEKNEAEYAAVILDHEFATGGPNFFTSDNPNIVRQSLANNNFNLTRSLQRMTDKHQQNLGLVNHWNPKVYPFPGTKLTDIEKKQFEAYDKYRELFAAGSGEIPVEVINFLNNLQETPVSGIIAEQGLEFPRNLESFGVKKVKDDDETNQETTAYDISRLETMAQKFGGPLFKNFGKQYEASRRFTRTGIEQPGAPGLGGMLASIPFAANNTEQAMNIIFGAFDIFTMGASIPIRAGLSATAKSTVQNIRRIRATGKLTPKDEAATGIKDIKSQLGEYNKDFADAIDSIPPIRGGSGDESLYVFDSIIDEFPLAAWLNSTQLNNIRVVLGRQAVVRPAAQVGEVAARGLPTKEALKEINNDIVREELLTLSAKLKNGTVSHIDQQIIDELFEAGIDLRPLNAVPDAVLQQYLRTASKYLEALKNGISDVRVASFLRVVADEQTMRAASAKQVELTRIQSGLSRAIEIAEDIALREGYVGKEAVQSRVNELLSIASRKRPPKAAEPVSAIKGTKKQRKAKQKELERIRQQEALEQAELRKIASEVGPLVDKPSAVPRVPGAPKADAGAVAVKGKRLARGTARVASRVSYYAGNRIKQETQEGFAGPIRLSQFPEELHDLIADYAYRKSDDIAEARRGVISDEDIRAEAARIAPGIVKRYKGTGHAFNAEEVRALRGVLDDAWQDAKTRGGELASLRDARLENASQNQITEAVVRFEMAVNKAESISKIYVGVSAEAGRALRAFRGNAKLLEGRPPAGSTNTAAIWRYEDNLRKLFREYKTRLAGEGDSPAHHSKQAAERLAEIGSLMSKASDDPEALRKLAQALHTPRWWDYPMELWYNSILSGPKTQIINALSNSINVLISPIERGTAAIIDLGLAPLTRTLGIKSDRQVERFMSEAGAEALGAVHGIGEGFRAFANTMKLGFSTHRATKYEMRPRAFTGVAGRVVNMPSNLLEAADALYYGINYSASRTTLASRRARKEGLRGRQALDRKSEILSDPIAALGDEKGAAFLKEADEMAEYRLFRNDPGGVANNIIRLREQYPPLRFIIPFIRTPTNIVKYGIERSALGVFSPRLWRNLRQGNAEASDQLARIFIGSTATAGIYMLFDAGVITGAAPTNPAERDQFYREGKLPYAMKLGGNWYQYRRVEPFNQIFSMVASIRQFQENMKEPDAEISDQTMEAIASFGNSLVSQTYVSNVADALNAFAGDTNTEQGWASTERFIERWLSGQMPYSSLLRTAEQITSPGLEVPGDAGMSDPLAFAKQAFAKQIPGVSGQLPKRITALGDVAARQGVGEGASFLERLRLALPVAVSPARKSAIDAELERVDQSISLVRPPKGITGQRESDYRRRVGEITESKLLELFASRKYNRELTIVSQKAAIRSAARAAKNQAKAEFMRGQGG